MNKLKHQRKLKGQTRMDNPEKLATLGTQGEDKQEWTIQRNWKHWEHKTQGEDKQEWTIQRNWQHWEQKTQGKDKQNI